MRGPKLLVGALLLALAPAWPTSGSEEDFILVDRMPTVEGELQRAITQAEAESGLTFTQRVYVQDSETAALFTYVTEATCAAGAQAAGPFIVALRYIVKRPQDFSTAALHDIYKEVYVEDREGRIRLYENLRGPEMIELTESFKPACSGI